MAESGHISDGYLAELAGQLRGSRRARRRLLSEIHDHLQDAASENRHAGLEPAQAEERAVEMLGTPDAVNAAWEARCSRIRRRQRGHGAVVAAAIAVAALLAAAQHADGRREPAQPTRVCAVSSASGPACRLQADGR